MLRNDTASTASSDDYQSVNLLLQNSPSIASLLPSPEKFAPSPATQTLDHLSQSTLPEHLMVMSPSPSLLARLELNAVTTLASVRSQSSPADFSYLLEEAQDQDQDDSSRIEKDTKPRSKKKSKKKPPSSKSTTAPTATASSTTTTGTGSRRRMSEEPSGRRTPDHKTAATATATSKTNRKTTTTKKNKKTKSFTTPTAKASSINNNHRKKSSPGLGRVVEKYSKAGQLLGTYSSLRNAEGATGVIRKYITACCQGTEELAGGFRWKFADDDERDMTAMANATTTTTTTTATSSSKTTKKATKKAAKKSHLTSPAIRLQKKQNKSNTTKSSTPSPGFREKRPVEQWENGHCVATFDSLTRAEFATRVSRKQISKCCDGLLGKAGGFIWKYSEQTTTENTTTAKKSSKTASPQVANKKRSVAKKKTEASLEAEIARVIQQWKGRRLVSSFSSAEEAADKTGISLRLLLEACQRGRGEVDGYQWKYASSENIENAKHSSREESKKRGRSPKGRDYQDGNGSQGRRQSSKHRDRQQDGREGRPDGREKKAIAHKQQEERKPKRRRKSRGKNRARAVQQWTIKGSLVETFPSMLQAEEITAVPRASIRLCCLGERSEAGGYVWKYCEEERSTEDAETDPTDPAEAGKGTSPTPIPRETESGQEQYSVRKERATAVATRSEGTSSPPPDDTCETYYHKTQGRTRKEQTSPVVDKIQPQKAKDHHALVPRPEANETTPPRLGESKGQKNYSSWKVGFKGETTFELGEVLSHANTKLDIEVLSCHIDRSGSLGLTIEHATPRNLKLGEIFGTACIVQTVRSGGLGERSGIQIGDCLLLEKEGGVLESEYYSIRNAASSGRRPLAFCVIRDRKVESSKKKAIDMELEQATQAHKTSKNRNVEAPEKGGTTIPEASEAAEKVHWTGSKEAAFKTEKAVGSKSITTAQVNPAGTKQKPSSVQAVKVATTGESTSTRKNSIVRSPSAVSTAQKTDKAADFCKYCNGRSKY